MHDTTVEIEPCDLGQLDANSPKTAQHVTQRRPDLAG